MTPAEAAFHVLASDHQEQYEDLTTSQREIYECVSRAVLAAAQNPKDKAYRLGRSIIHDCPALILPQNFVQRLGMTAQIVPLKGVGMEAAQQIVADCNVGYFVRGSK
jgi:hypothetical protein